MSQPSTAAFRARCLVEASRASNEASGASRTYVVSAGGRVVGYYALATGAVAQQGATGKVRRNMPDPIPVMVVGRFGCGPMQSVFLADGEETGDRFSVSIWWVDPHQPGPGPHAHAANEELFDVIEGTMTFRLGDQCVDAASGTFVRVPAGVTHDFENRTSARAGILNVFIPGGFETRMPAIVDWYRERDGANR
jgi:mannose-6-phosphate isomerase-like protein (cupin superfamily)